MIGLEGSGRVGMSNDRAPNFQEVAPPVHRNAYEMRYIRHLEFYGEDSSTCAPVSSSRTFDTAMQNGVVNVGQWPSEGMHLCAFDLVVWKPRRERGDR